MKKFTLIVYALSLGCSLFGQSQRLVLVEEFTQASCTECAAENPDFNTLLSNNPNKVTSIMYHTSQPGVDPMNADNAVDNFVRYSFYSPNTIPTAPMDGVDLPYTGSTYWPGAPAIFTQQKINTEYAVPSPFTIAVSHTFSADVDSIYITETITCTQAITAPMVNVIALVEKQVTFATAPGANGETTFKNVMKKMYPSALGTTLSPGWTVGTVQTITVGAPIPNTVYDLHQIAVVAFIQNSGSRVVEQAGYSAPISLPTSTADAGISAINHVPAVNCVDTIRPIVTLKNFSSTPLNVCTINYQIDGGTVATQTWSGSLSQNATAQDTLPSLTVAAGAYILTVFTSQPNLSNDYFINNNKLTQRFVIVGTNASAPLTQGFATFPPSNWVIDNPDNSYTWESVSSFGGFSNTGQCTKLNFLQSPAGSVDDLYAPPVDLLSDTASSHAHAVLMFDVAHANYSTENDKLEAQVSTDCGTTWTTVYSKQGTDLSTVSGFFTTAFSPVDWQWRKDGADLTPYVAETNLLIRFRGISAFGNNLYLDNINIVVGASALGIDSYTNNNTMDVYPNPANEKATIEYNLTSDSEVSISISSTLGETVYSNTLGKINAGNHLYNLNTQKLNAGIYFVTLNTGETKMIKKIIVSK